jgi:hypothetical protein
VHPLSLAAPECLPACIQLFNKLVYELGQAPRVGFIGYQLTELSPLLFFLNWHEGSKATTLPIQRGEAALNLAPKSVTAQDLYWHPERGKGADCTKILHEIAKRRTAEELSQCRAQGSTVSNRILNSG